MRQFEVFMVGVIISLAVGASWSMDGRLVDVDGDNYKEAEVFYSGKEIVKALIDNDHDGFRETVVFYKNGFRDRAEEDLDRDGKVDRWIYYYFTGAAWKVAEDSDRDGVADYWFYLKDRRIYRWEQDRDGDGKVDVRTVYEWDKTGQRRFLAQQSYDNDRDGLFESLSGITATKRPSGIPHSLAEALLR